MAKVIRSRWVFRPHGRWHRYLPRRNDAVKEYDYETAGGSIASFKEELRENDSTQSFAAPSKLWMAWLYRDLTVEPKWTKQRVQKLFGADFKVGRMEIFANTESVNEELWHIKHLIELKPVVFTNGEPTEKDVYGLKLHPDGRCEIAPEGDVKNEKQLKLYDESKQWTRSELRAQLDAKYFSMRDVFETNVYTPSNTTIVK